MKRPAFQFYPGDWRKDVELRACSLAARGLWIDLMCVAHECEPYGHLVLNGNPMTMQQLAGQIGVPAAQVKKLLDELIASGVARIAENGAIYSKRMVEDERVRNARAEGGKAGAEHGEKGASHGIKGGRPPKDKGGFKTPLAPVKEPPPSSSSSPSGNSVPDGTGNGSPPLPGGLPGGLWPENELPLADAPPRRQKLTDPKEIIFGYGLTLLTNAGTPEPRARSFLGGLAKQHGNDGLVNALRDCAKESPIDPVGWLAKRLQPPRTGHHGLDLKNYREGIDNDGHII